MDCNVTTTPPTAAAAAADTALGARGGGDPKSLPTARATYEMVVADPSLFMSTLEGLHRSLGTKFMVPTIGGRILDLHRLFVEVTSRGGLEKTIGDRKWRDVIAVFSFPPTITSASFVLRKYYLSLLHPYEQVYFFGNKHPQIAVDDGASRSSPPQASTVTTQLNENSVPGSAQLQSGCSVTGKIRGKFDIGYIVTASFGTEELSGVLYHVPLGSPEPQNVTSFFTVLPSGMKRSRRAMKDPSRPKSHRSGYNFFFAEQCAKLKPLYSREERVMRIGDMWNKLNAEEKEVYQQKGVEDVERYRTEMLEYRKSQSASKVPRNE